MRKKRLFAYIVDYLIISLLISLITSIPSINPNKQDTLKYSELYLNTYEEYIENPNDELFDKINEYGYKMIKSNVVYQVIEIAIVIAYFGILQYQLNGQTLGKKWQKIRIKSTKNDLTLFKTVFRSIILQNILFKIINIVLVYTVSIKRFTISSGTVSFVSNFVTIIILLTILIRKDGIGLHDQICHTKVVEVK